jgi:short-subunit dehydrogenase
MAVCGATKAFVLSVSRALWAETRTSGVAVLALTRAPPKPVLPGAGEDAAVGSRRITAQVVSTAVHAMAEGRPSVVAGSRTRSAPVSPRAPERLAIAITERSVRPAAVSPTPEPARS